MHKPIFSADDFGLTISVNEAVERAYTEGVLTQASLMVAAPAAADAVARAKKFPGLNTGLHLVLVEGDSMLGHTKLPNITTPEGKFSKDQAALGVKYFFSPAARRELKAEIQAQFAAYAATGLKLHHADAHKHMHLHPTVGGLLLRIGAEFGLRAIRIPAEPPRLMAALGSPGGRMLYRWTALLRARARAAGMAMNDAAFGLAWSGHMTEARLLRLLPALPEGVSEIYFHPAAGRDAAIRATMPSYEHEAELAALVSPAVRAALAGMQLCGYGDL
jgi:hopanoid biosynthesis associated protein HpnK